MVETTGIVSNLLILYPRNSDTQNFSNTLKLNVVDISFFFNQNMLNLAMVVLHPSLN